MKSGLDASELKNYRPVSNLSFLSKLLEKTAQVRIQTFFDGNGLMPKMQSAYRRHHSTETAVTKVFNDLLLAADGGQMSAGVQCKSGVRDISTVLRKMHLKFCCHCKIRH